MTRLFAPLAALGAAAMLTACGGGSDADTTTTERPASAARADTEQTVAGYGSNDRVDSDGGMSTANSMMSREFDVLNGAGRSIGSVTIKDTASGVDVMLDVTSIPAGSHAIHFHETGTCDGPDFTSAGGHYNPTGHNHGFEAASPNPHAGDMRNFDAPQSGVVRTTVKNDRVSLSERSGMAPLFDANGTALIIHAAADDYVSQPSGAAGARIACAVVAR